MAKSLPKSIEALNLVKVELESRASGMKQVFGSGADKMRIDFKANFAMIPYGQLARVKQNRKFGYTFFLSKRGVKAVEAIEGTIAELKDTEAKAEAKAKKEADEAAKKAAADAKK